MSEVGAPGAGAPAPASTPAPAQSVPLPDRGASPPNPATSTPAAPKDEVSTGQPPSGKERKSIDDSIRDAATKVEAKTEAKEKAEPKAAPKTEAKTPAVKPEAKDAPAKPSPRERDDGGRFASLQPKEPAAEPQGEPHHQPPHRFSPEAKAEWANVPDTVKAEVHRAHRELENGYHKYRQDAEAYNEVRDIVEFAKQTGQPLRQWHDSVRRIEHDLISPDVEGKARAIEHLLKLAGVTPQQYAAHVTQQPMRPQEQRDAEQRQIITSLERRLAAAEQREAERDRRDQFKEIDGSVKEFARERPRFNELSDTIATFLNGQNDRGIHIDPQRRLPAEQRLQQAYDLAEELNPSARTSASFSPEPRPANGAGQKSIAGSPANGSDPTLPAKKGKHPSIDESIRRAAARGGFS